MQPTIPHENILKFFFSKGHHFDPLTSLQMFYLFDLCYTLKTDYFLNREKTITTDQSLVSSESLLILFFIFSRIICFWRKTKRAPALQRVIHLEYLLNKQNLMDIFLGNIFLWPKKRIYMAYAYTVVQSKLQGFIFLSPWCNLGLHSCVTKSRKRCDLSFQVLFLKLILPIQRFWLWILKWNLDGMKLIQGRTLCFNVEGATFSLG